MTKRNIFIGLGLLLVLGLGFFLYTFFQPEAVEAYQVQREDVIAALTVTGEVEAEKMIAISPPVQARIQNILIEEGDPVSPGQLLVVLDQEEARQRVEQAIAQRAQAQAALQNILQGTRAEEIARLQAQVQESQAQLSQFQAALEVARSELADATSNAQRLQPLFQEGAISAREYEQAVIQRQAAEAQVARAQAETVSARTRIVQSQESLRLAQAGATRPEIAEAQAARAAADEAVDIAQAQLRDTRILNKTNGVVVDKIQEVGELGVPGQAILRIATLDDLKITTFVEEVDLSRIQVGYTAIIVMDAYPDTPISAHVTRIGKEVNPENGTVEVELRITRMPEKPPSNFRLLPGMTVDANIVTKSLKNTLVIPATAIERVREQTMVYVFENSHLVRKPVQLQRISLEYYLVLEGLNKGDWIAMPITPDLLEKKRVRPVPAPATIP